jgi:hypothetical protein
VIQACANAAAAQQTLKNLHDYYHGKSLDPTAYNSYMIQRTADEQAVANTQKFLGATRQAFENAMQKYQSLGGTVDYRRQLPQ